MDEENNIELQDEVAEGHDMKNAEQQSVASVDKAAGSTSQSTST